MKSQLPQKHSGFVGDSGSTRLAKADGRGRWEPISQIRRGESEAQWAGAGGRWPSAHTEEGIGRTEFPPCSVASSPQMTPALGSNGEGLCRQERKGPEPCTATSGWPQPDLFAHQVQGKEGRETTLHPTYWVCVGAPASTIWQLIPIFLVPYNIVAVLYADSRERIKHYALDKHHPFAKFFPHLSPNKNILNDYTEPKRCWSLPKV